MYIVQCTFYNGVSFTGVGGEKESAADSKKEYIKFTTQMYNLTLRFKSLFAVEK